MNAEAEDIQTLLGKVKEKLKDAGYREAPISGLHEYFDIAAAFMLDAISKDIPCEWAFYVAGSWGQKRVRPSSDQDHFIFFTRRLSPQTLQILSRKFEIMEAVLELLGLQRCSGKIMASNPEWQFVLPEFQMRPGFAGFLDAYILMQGRKIAGTAELKPDINGIFHSSAYRKKGFSFLLYECFLVAFGPSKKRIDHFRSFEHIERILYLSKNGYKMDVPPARERKADLGRFEGTRRCLLVIKVLLQRFSFFFS